MDIATATLVAAGIGASVAIAIALINLWQNRRIEDIHVLVNDRLDKALAEIASLKDQLRIAISEKEVNQNAD